MLSSSSLAKNVVHDMHDIEASSDMGNAMDGDRDGEILKLNSVDFDDELFVHIEIIRGRTRRRWARC